MDDSLQKLLDDGVIDDVRTRLMSGKEASVYIVERKGELVAAKVYKSREQRTFKATASYTEGRNQTRNTRDKRAMGKRTAWGKELIESSWRDMEYAALTEAFQAGVRVPEPYLLYDDVLLMQLLVDEQGAPAPRLADFDLPADVAELLHREIYGQVRLLLGIGKIHGDLSAFNVLIAEGGPTIIDMPQVVDAAGNNNAAEILRRDLKNVTEHLAKFDARLLRFNDCGLALFQHWQRGTLEQALDPQEGTIRSDTAHKSRRVRDAERGKMGRGAGRGQQAQAQHQQAQHQQPQTQQAQHQQGMRGPPPDLRRGPPLDQRRGPPPDQRPPQRDDRGPPPPDQRRDRGPPPDQRRDRGPDDRGPPPDQRRDRAPDDRGPPPDQRRDDRGPPPDQRRDPPPDQRRDRGPDDRGPPPDQRRDDRGPPPDLRRDGRGPLPDQRRDRGPPPDQRRDDRGPPPDQHRDRGPPPDQRRDDRGPPLDQRRGPPPDQRRGPPPDQRRDDRGPPPDQRRDDRGSPPDLRRDDRGPPPDQRRGPPPAQRRDDRGPPPDLRRDRPPQNRGPDQRRPGPDIERRPPPPEVQRRPPQHQQQQAPSTPAPMSPSSSNDPDRPR